MPRTGFCLRCVVLGLFIIAWMGCTRGGTDGPKQVPVSGTVTLDGKPLANAMITFAPAGKTRGAGASGRTDKDGRYQLTYLRGKMGTPAGQYRVAISKRVMPDGKDVPENDKTPPIESPARETLPPIYSSEQDSTLSATVPEAGGKLDFALKSKR